jgi:hypothetical protein
MIDKDRKPFFALIAGVYAFYDKGFSDFAGRVWWEAVKPFDLSAVTDALNRHCVNPDVGQFMPKPADVVRMLQGSTQDAGLVAWAKVDRAIREVGTYRSVVFEDALIHRIVLEMGGWVLLGAKGEDEWPFVKNEFVNRYRGYRGRSEIPDYPPVLIGMAEAHNRKAGFQVEAPVLIGNPDAAGRVLAGGSSVPVLQFQQMAPAAAAKALQLVDTRARA